MFFIAACSPNMGIGCICTSFWSLNVGVLMWEFQPELSPDPSSFCSPVPLCFVITRQKYKASYDKCSKCPTNTHPFTTNAFNFSWCLHCILKQSLQSQLYRPTSKWPCFLQYMPPLIVVSSVEDKRCDWRDCTVVYSEWRYTACNYPSSPCSAAVSFVQCCWIAVARGGRALDPLRRLASFSCVGDTTFYAKSACVPRWSRMGCILKGMILAYFILTLKVNI